MALPAALRCYGDFQSFPAKLLFAGCVWGKTLVHSNRTQELDVAAENGAICG